MKIYTKTTDTGRHGFIVRTKDLRKTKNAEASRIWNRFA